MPFASPLRLLFRLLEHSHSDLSSEVESYRGLGTERVPTAWTSLAASGSPGTTPSWPSFAVGPSILAQRQGSLKRCLLPLPPTSLSSSWALERWTDWSYSCPHTVSQLPCSLFAC